jgi:hypothetical protein
MKKTILLAMSLLLCSCAVVSVDVKRTEGKITECSGVAYAMFLSLNEIGLSACGAKTEAQGVKGDVDMIGAISGGVAAGVAGALKK